MADLSYTVDVDVNSGIRSLDKLTNRIDAVSKSFGGMKTALLGLGFATAMTNAVRMADDLQDLSNATGISTANLLEFKKALSTSGGQADQMAAALNVFVRSIDEAAQGSVTAQKAFKDAGISLEDLRKLGERDLMIKTLEGIAKIDDAGRRATLMMDKFGKSFKTVDPGELANKLRETAGEGEKYAAAIKRAAELNDNLTTAQGNLSVALLMAFEPIILKINNFNAAMDESGVKMDGLINIIKTLGIVIASSFALSFGLKFVALIGQIGRGLTVIAKQIDKIQGVAIGAKGGAMSGLFAATGNLMVALRSVVALVAVLGTAIYAASELFDDFGSVAVNALARIVEGIGSMMGMLGGGAFGAGVGAVFGPVGAIIGGIAGAFAGDKLADLFGLNSFIDKARQAREEAEKIAVYAKKIGGGRGVVNPPLVKGDNSRDVTDAEAEKNALEQIKIANDLQKALSKIRVSYMQLGEEAQHNNDTLVNNLKFENSLIGKTEEQVELARALRAEADSLINLKDQLAKKAQEINDEVSEELNLQKKLNQLQTTTEATTTAKEKDIAASKNKVIVLESEKAQIDKLIGVYQNMHTQNGAAIEKYITQQQTLKLLEKDRLQNIENITKAIEDQVARQQTLAGILQGINDKKVDMAFELRIKDFTPLEKQFAQIDEDARKAALEAARSFAAGFADVDMTAEKTKELADGLEKIANSYKGIADAQIRNLEDSRSWSAGWKTAFDSYMENATNAAKRAGEVFNAITSNMNSAIDKFVENGKFSFEDLAKSIIKDLIKIELKAQAVKLLGFLGGGDIFSSISKLFGYAEGGSPPINKPSIVGEKGPELFVPRSAGTIIPNGAGGGGVVNKTYITNNISAIDSKSVAQMFAENRKALLGTVQLAQKELPYGNR